MKQNCRGLHSFLIFQGILCDLSMMEALIQEKSRVLILSNVLDEEKLWHDLTSQNIQTIMGITTFEKAIAVLGLCL